jgi:TPR repeat protein
MPNRISLFAVQAHEVMQVYQLVRDSLEQNKVSEDEFNYQDEKTLFKGAKQGHAETQCQLDEAYDNFKRAEEITLDFKKANYWYRKTAEQGNAPAQEALTGLGIDRENT